MHPATAGIVVDPLPLATVAVIPARFASTRFPGKPLAEIHGLPMIEHVYRRAAACPSVAHTLVATDDERVAAAVRRFGGEVRLTRPDHRSGTDRLAEVAAALVCDVVVNVQGDEPLIDPSAIAQVVAALASDPEVSIATLARRLDDPADARDPNVVKVVVDRRGFALLFSRAAIPYRMAAEVPAPNAPLPFFKHIGVYAYRRRALVELARLEPTPLERLESLEQLRALEHGVRIKVIETEYDSIGVDTPADLERVRLRMTGG